MRLHRACLMFHLSCFMRILVIAPTPFFSDRGTHIRILEEALALEKLGHSITIATYHIGRDILEEVDTKIDVRRIRRLLFWYKKLEAGPDWQKIILDLMLIRKAFYLARTQKPDIIHGHLHEGALIGWIVQKALFWRKMKLVADFHGSLTAEMVSHGYLKGGLNQIFKLVEKMINRMGDGAIASSWEGAEEIGKSRNSNDVEVVLDGTNLESFDLPAAKQAIRKELELPEAGPVIIYTGGLVKNKGIDHLLEASKMILEKKPDAFFLIGGFPVEYAQNFIRENKLEKNMRLVSPLDYFKLPQVLMASDIAVDPKNSETTQASGKMLNYMSAGLPVVCFDTPNNRNYLGAGGLYCKEMTPNGIADGILRLIDNPAEAEEKGRLNKEKAKEFNWDNSGKKIEKIYLALLSKDQLKYEITGN